MKTKGEVDERFEEAYSGEVRGFVRVFSILVLFVLFGAGSYYIYKDYQPYKASKNFIMLLPKIDSSFDYSFTANFNHPSAFPPRTIAAGGFYQSPFPPCVTLIEDRNWDLFIGRHNLFPNGKSQLLFERFWNIAWLVLPTENDTPVFYGPFRISDLPERSYIDYLLIGRDIRQEGSNLVIINSKTDCISVE